MSQRDNILQLIHRGSCVALAGAASREAGGLLDSAAARSAPWRQALGDLAPGEPVPLLASDPLQLLEALLTLWQMDLLPVPLDHRMGSATLTSVLDQVQPRVVLLGQPPGGHQSAALRGIDTPPLDELLLATDGEPAPDAPSPARRGADPALVIFTSGSTGRPKGVVLTHGNLSASVDAILDYLPVARFPHTGVVLPLHYGYALIGQALVTLAAGGRLTLLGHLRFASQLLDGLMEAGVQGLSSVPTSLRLICDVAQDDGVALHSVGYVGSAGARLPPELPALLRRCFPGARLFNQYGCTEAAPRVSFIEDQDPGFAAGSVGRAVRGLELAVLRPDGGRAHHSEQGEIGIRGPTVTPGLLGPGLRSGALEPAAARSGFLLTGDLGRLDQDGLLTVAGRRDRMVKCAGERVSLEQVEQVLRKHPSVQDAAVVALDHPLLGVQLVAMVQGQPEHLDALMQHITQELGPARRPARVHHVASIPCGSSGKVQRAALERLARTLDGS